LMPTPILTPEIINAAIVGFEQQRLRLDTQIAELRAMLDGSRPEPVSTPEVPKSKRRRMSPAALKRISDAQRKRWAASKGESESVSKSTTKPKRTLSAAGKAAIVAALKKRWAVKRAAAKKAPAKTAAKKAANTRGVTGTATRQ
jgi:hypothetical protein